MKSLLAVIVLSVSALLFPVTSQAVQVESFFVGNSSPSKIYYGSTSFYYYPNRLIVPSHYSHKTIRDMARLSRHLGWKQVYILSPRHAHGMPTHLRQYAHQQFYRNGIRYEYYYYQQPRVYRYYDNNRRYYDHSNRHYYDKKRRHYYNDRYHRDNSRGSGIYFRFSF